MLWAITMIRSEFERDVIRLGCIRYQLQIDEGERPLVLGDDELEGEELYITGPEDLVVEP
jgi:hypothetical protein